MKEFLQLMRRFVSPYKKYIGWAILLNILSAVFNVFSFTLLIPILDILENEIEPLKEQGVVWGYNIPYLLTGQLNQHPRTAIAATKEKRTDYRNFYVELVDYK